MQREVEATKEISEKGLTDKRSVGGVGGNQVLTSMVHGRVGLKEFLGTPLHSMGRSIIQIATGVP